MDITKFCADEDDVRTYMGSPIQLDACIAATNGHICIFDTKPSITAPRYAISVGTLARMQELFNECMSVQKWIAHNPLPLPDKLDCTYCNGTGHLTKKNCPECGGDCYVSFENDFNEYTVSCETCYGKGVVIVHEEPFPVCEACNGEKQVWDERITFIVEGVRISPVYYSLFKDAPNLQLAVKDERMLYFKSGQYIGALMGMRQ